MQLTQKAKQERLEKVAKESGIVVNKRNNGRCELRNDDTAIKQVQKINYLGSIILDAKYDVKIRRGIRISNVASEIQASI